MSRCLLALGANLGDRQRTLEHSLCQISAIPHTRFFARSTWHETPAVGGPAGQGEFLNGVVLVDTELAAQEFASQLQDLEKQHGRERKVRWAARTLDIDLLLFGDDTIHTPELEIPHPRMTFRRFVLDPAAEIAGHWVVTESGWTIAALGNHLRTAARFVAITSAEINTANWLADELCQRLKSPRLEEFLPFAPNDALGLSAVEWEKHKELRQRLPEHHRNQTESITPVICSCWHFPELTNWLPDAVLPALQIIVAPSSGVLLHGEMGDLSWQESSKPINGPLACITANTPEGVIEEALAAIGAVWPV